MKPEKLTSSAPYPLGTEAMESELGEAFHTSSHNSIHRFSGFRRFHGQKQRAACAQSTEKEENERGTKTRSTQIRPQRVLQAHTTGKLLLNKRVLHQLSCRGARRWIELEALLQEIFPFLRKMLWDFRCLFFSSNFKVECYLQCKK